MTSILKLYILLVLFVDAKANKEMCCYGLIKFIDLWQICTNDSLCPLHHRSLLHVLRNLIFLNQLSSGEQFLNLLIPSSTRIYLLIPVQKADFTWTTFLFAMDFLKNWCLYPDFQVKYCGFIQNTLVWAACARWHGTKCPLLTAFFPLSLWNCEN